MTSSEIKSLSLGTQSLSQKALWEIAFQVSSVVDILAATEPGKRAAGIERCQCCGNPLYCRECGCRTPILESTAPLVPRSRPSEPSAEAQTQPPDFVGAIISAELHYTNPAVPPGLVRVTLDVTDAEYQKLLDSQKLAATEASKTEAVGERGDEYRCKYCQAGPPPYNHAADCPGDPQRSKPSEPSTEDPTKRRTIT